MLRSSLPRRARSASVEVLCLRFCDFGEVNLCDRLGAMGGNYNMHSRPSARLAEVVNFKVLAVKSCLTCLGSPSQRWDRQHIEGRGRLKLERALDDGRVCLASGRNSAPAKLRQNYLHAGPRSYWLSELYNDLLHRRCTNRNFR